MYITKWPSESHRHGTYAVYYNRRFNNLFCNSSLPHNYVLFNVFLAVKSWMLLN